MTAQTGPGWARQPARRADTVRARPGPVVERSGAGREPGARPPAAAPCAGGVTRMWAGPQGLPEKVMYRAEPASEGESQCRGVQRVGQGCKRRTRGQG